MRDCDKQEQMIAVAYLLAATNQYMAIRHEKIKQFQIKMPQA